MASIEAQPLPMGSGGIVETEDAGNDGVIPKTMAVLEAFREEEQGLGARAIARKIGLPKSTVHRLLTQMEAAGFLERQGSLYSIGLKLFELGNYAAFCEPGGMRDTALPFLSDLYSRGGDCVVTLGVVSQNRILCIEKIRGHSSPRTESRVGRPLPATNSCLGKAILAYSPPETVQAFVDQGLERATEYSVTRPELFLRQLETVRETGVAIDNQESILGLSGVAAPVFLNGDVVGSVALTHQTAMFQLQYTSSLVKETAQRLGRALAMASTRKNYVPLLRIG